MDNKLILLFQKNLREFMDVKLFDKFKLFSCYVIEGFDWVFYCLYYYVMGLIEEEIYCLFVGVVFCWNEVVFCNIFLMW